MKLLKNDSAFKRWKKKNTYPLDIVAYPREFPCYVLMVVESCAYETEQTVYFYRDDLKNMLTKMEGQNASHNDKKEHLRVWS